MSDLNFHNYELIMVLFHTLWAFLHFTWYWSLEQKQYLPYIFSSMDRTLQMNHYPNVNIYHYHCFFQIYFHYFLRPFAIIPFFLCIFVILMFYIHGDSIFCKFVLNQINLLMEIFLHYLNKIFIVWMLRMIDSYFYDIQILVYHNFVLLFFYNYYLDSKTIWFIPFVGI